MLEFLQRHVWPITAISVVIFFAAIIAGGWIVVRMPSDYFRRPIRESTWLEGYPRTVRVTLHTLKNILGVLLVLVGLGLSLPLVPGPGVVTILVGLSLTDFPGKRKLEQWLVGKRMVLAPLNWLRARWKRPPLQPPVTEADLDGAET
jgi:hypothetical protein